MIKILKYIREGVPQYYTIHEYLVQYCATIPEGWTEIVQELSKLLLSVETTPPLITATVAESGAIEISKLRDNYKSLQTYSVLFEDDIIVFMAFLLSSKYFSLIGNPDFEKWINSKSLHKPFEIQEQEDLGFSLREIVKYEFGQNAVRKQLLTCLPYISSQGGN